MPRSNNPPVVTVSQVNHAVSMLIGGDRRFASVAVRGEISNFTRHYKTGHLYFTLKDEQTQLKAVMFAGNAAGLEFQPENGAKVVCFGAIKVYEPSGVYQINCTDMQPDGEGEQAAALEALKEKLSAEGVFSQHRDIPRYPQKIAVVTSAGGAALQDVINIISRRYPVVKLVIVPAAVQGVSAPQSIAAAIGRAQDTGADTIIFGRGGGSAEDLAAFNTEIVARAVYGSEIPTISAVGHETDFTIADLAADMRAPTPSAAAELAVPDSGMLLSAILGTGQELSRRMARQISRLESEISTRSEVIKALSPQQRIANAETRLTSLEARISDGMHRKLDTAERSVIKSAEIISALNPMSVLTRGYSVASIGDDIITDSSSLSIGDRISVRLAKGRITAAVENIE